MAKTRPVVYDYRGNPIDEQVATLQAKLHDPSTPDSVKPSLEAAITRIAYRPRRMEVTR